jgi:hypothetical protein
MYKTTPKDTCNITDETIFTISRPKWTFNDFGGGSIISPIKNAIVALRKNIKQKKCNDIAFWLIVNTDLLLTWCVICQSAELRKYSDTN